MLKFRKKILAAALCAAMTLTASQSVAWSETAESTEPVSTSEADSTPEDTGEEAAPQEEEEAPPADITEEEALAAMEECARTSSLALYVNKETGVFAVENLANGYYWWSNPYNADNDPVVGTNNTKKNELKSSVVINSVMVTDTDAANTLLRSAANGTTTIDTSYENGFKATVEFSREGIRIPYTVTLKDDYFEISIIADEIYEVEINEPDKIMDSSRSIVDVGLFQDLGAGGLDEEGYIVTPDGSGAVINFNNGRTGASDYSQQLYGRDLAISQNMAPKKTEQAYLPILGLVKEDNALLLVATEGSAYATAKASIARGPRATGYNSAWFNFSLRSTDGYFMGGSNAQALKAYQQNKVPEPRMTVRYYPIAKDNASYVDIAQRYQKYLVDEKGMTKKTSADDAHFYLDLFGGTVKERSVVGFPVKLQTTATTYEQAEEIVRQLNERGVADMIVTYEDFNKAGITSRISNSLDYASSLGGKDKFENLRKYLESIGAVFAPSVDLMNYERSGNGYSKSGASVIGVTKAYATQGVYERAFGTPHDTRTSWYILTPAYYEKVYGEVISAYNKGGLGAISVAEGTNMLYSDFTSNSSRNTSRQQALENLKNCYQMINNSGMTFVSSACNDYALPYVDMIRDVPLYSSSFDVYDYDIPLYEMVIHGYIPYTTKAKNASSSADELFLLSVATGTPVHYKVMYENPNTFTDSSYDTLFYTYYAGWLDVAAAEYKVCKDIVSGVSEATITDFEYVSEDVVKTTFSNGTVIEADLDRLTLKVNGIEKDLTQLGSKGANK